MTKEVVSVRFDATAEDAARLMAERNVGSVVVLDQNERVVGIITDRQVAVNVLGAGREGGTPIREVMTSNPATVTLDDNIFSVVDTMRSAHMARRIPVVDQDKHLLGIVSISDVAVVVNRLLTEVMREETHHALDEAHLLTGGKRVAREIASPTQQNPQDMATRQQHATAPGTQGRTPATGGGRTTGGAGGSTTGGGRAGGAGRRENA